MASMGFPITIVAGLVLVTGAALVLTPKDILRSAVVDTPTDFAQVEVASSPRVLPSAKPVQPAIQYASLTVEVTPLSGPEVVSDELDIAPAIEDVRWITASALNMRAEPNKFADHVASLPNGTRVKVSETSGSWALVTAPDGSSGWLSQNFLTANRPAQ